VVASGLADLLECLEKDSCSELSPLASGPSHWQWYLTLAGDEWVPEKIVEPTTSEVRRGAAAADAEVKTMEAAESPSAPATAPATTQGVRRRARNQKRQTRRRRA
jgi:hypothetical protein